MTRPAHVGYSLTDNSNPEKIDERIFQETKTFSVSIAYTHLTEINHSREPRVFTELPMCESYVSVWTDMFLMLYIVKHFCSSMSTKFVIDADYDAKELRLSYDRYTMNPVGMEIGYETWQATFPIREKTWTELNGNILRTLINNTPNGMEADWYRWCVLLDRMEVECIDAPDTETCECDNPEECNCELYVSPIDEGPEGTDFGYQEFTALICDVVENTQACWKYENDQWTAYVDYKKVW